MTTPLYISRAPEAAAAGYLPAIHLIVEHFAARETQRQREIDYCLQQNAANPHIDRIHVMAERLPPVAAWGLEAGHFEIVGRDGRMTFAQCFEYIAASVTPGAICIVANADIFFDDTLALLKLQDMQGRAFALLRYEQLEDGTIELHGTNHRAPMYHPNVLRGGCQDSWIFQTPLPPLQDSADFYVGGVHLCDSKINWVLHNAGLEVTNPCYSIRSIHVHRSQVRNTVRSSVCSEPPFYCPKPCHLPVRFELAGTDAPRLGTARS